MTFSQSINSRVDGPWLICGCGASATDGASGMLREAGFETLESPAVPLNDFGICVGQLWVALRADRGNEPEGGTDRCAWRCRD